MAKSTSKPRPDASRTPKRPHQDLAPPLVIVLILLLAGAAVVLAASANAPAQPVMTLEPEIVQNLTRLPQATPLSGDAARQWNDFRATVIACGDYRPERRRQMEQHIDWLIDPSGIPTDVIIALGPNPTGRLIFGMASYTSSEWRLRGRNPDSCLVSIGRALNAMLLSAGEEPFDLYDDIEAQ